MSTMHQKALPPKDAATPQDESQHVPLPLLSRDPSSPYRIGTRFLREVAGWSICEGVVDEFEGECYTVTYATSRARGQALVTIDALQDMTMMTNWDAHQLKEDQHVWAFVRIT